MLQTYLVKYRIDGEHKPLVKNIAAENMKDALDKLKNLHQNASIVSYLQM